eukprot:NODE_212_length_12593_cov_0.662638.p9 type:complete len:211 gc:universal NODE_212_length_12593_cov_0.662638:5711-6343(+)
MDHIVNLPEIVIELIFIYSGNSNFSIICKKIHSILKPSLYNIKLYSKRFKCRCDALRNLIKLRCFNPEIAEYLTLQNCHNCNSSNMPILGYNIPYSLFWSKISTKLVNLGGVKYHDSLFAKAIEKADLRCIKKARKHLRVPAHQIIKYLEKLNVTSSSISVHSALKRLNLPTQNLKMTKYLIKQLSDRDALRIAFQVLNIPQHLAYDEDP